MNLNRHPLFSSSWKIVHVDFENFLQKTCLLRHTLRTVRFSDTVSSMLWFTILPGMKPYPPFYDKFSVMSIAILQLPISKTYVEFIYIYFSVFILLFSFFAVFLNVLCDSYHIFSLHNTHCIFFTFYFNGIRVLLIRCCNTKVLILIFKHWTLSFVS